MSRILTLWQAGVGELVREFASEGAGLRKPPPKKKSSPMARAIAHLRSSGIQVPGYQGAITYEDARNVYRRALRSAERAGRMMQRLREGRDYPAGGAPPKRGRGPPPTEDHRVLVVMTTPSGVEYRGLVLVENVPIGTSVSAILSKAVEMARDQSLYTGKGSQKATPKTSKPTRVEILSSDPSL